MAAGVEIDMTGATIMLERLQAGLPDTVGDAAYATAQDTAGRIRSTVPRRTGRLAGSVRTVRSGDQVRVELGAPYARYVAWPAVNRATQSADTAFAARAEISLERMAATL